MATDRRRRPHAAAHEVALSTKLSQMRITAREKGLEFSVTRDFLLGLFLIQDSRCALSGLPIGLTPDSGTASLDRKNSSLGYTPENVQWTHVDLNRMKLAHDQAHFVELCRLVVAHADRSGNAG